MQTVPASFSSQTPSRTEVISTTSETKKNFQPTFLPEPPALTLMCFYEPDGRFYAANSKLMLSLIAGFFERFFNYQTLDAGMSHGKHPLQKLQIIFCIYEIRFSPYS